MTDLAYSGSSHSRAGARAALTALLSAAPFGTFAELRMALGTAGDDLPGGVIKDGPIVTHVFDNDPLDARLSGDSELMTRLALFSEVSRPSAYFGGEGTEVRHTIALDWLVVADAQAGAWRTAVFDHGLAVIGTLLEPLTRAPHTDWIELEIGEANFTHFDLGEAAASSASVQLIVTLDAAHPLA